VLAKRGLGERSGMSETAAPLCYFRGRPSSGSVSHGATDLVKP
jgi:hypothetical protein